MIRPLVRGGAYVSALVFLATGAVTAVNGGPSIGIAFVLLAVCIAVAVYDPWSFAHKHKAAHKWATTVVGDCHLGMPEKAGWKDFKKTVERTQR